MNRDSTFRPIFSLFICASLATFTLASAKEKRLNILFIVCDDLNTHVSTSGYQHIKTPNFDKLAADSMKFNRAYCQYPVCGPSRASFLNSLYPESTGVVSNKTKITDTRPGTVSLPQHMKNNGYWTASTGKIFHNDKTNPGELAWHETVGFKNDEMPIEKKAKKEFEAKHGPVTERKNRKKWKEFLLGYAPQTMNQKPGWGPSGLTDEQHKDGKNAKQVLDWINSNSYGDKPFFIAMGIHKPHIPYLAPDKYFKLYPKDKLVYDAAPSKFWDQAPHSAMDGRYKSMGFELGKENPERRKEFMQAYHACISFIDAQIGLVIDGLKKKGIYEDTIIVLTSDHGYQLGEHFMWGKVTLFEICNRVPFIIRVPGMTKPGSSSEALVELIDCYPTFTDLCGIGTPEHVQGRSLVKNLADTKAIGREAVYTVVGRNYQKKRILGKAIRTSRWRYAKWPDGEELYDLEKDIMEHNNLAKDKTHTKTLQIMRAHLVETQKRAASKAHNIKK